MNIPRVDGLSTGPPRMGRHSINMGYIWILIICINYNYPWYVNVHVALIYTCNINENALA